MIVERPDIVNKKSVIEYYKKYPELIDCTKQQIVKKIAEILDIDDKQFIWSYNNASVCLIALVVLYDGIKKKLNTR